MTEDDRERETETESYGPKWPPSPKMQIILIAIGFGLLNVLLLVIWAIALYMSR